MSRFGPAGTPCGTLACVSVAIRPHRDLLGLEGLPAEAIRAILDRAHAHADDIATSSVEPTLAGRFVCTLFLEDSTRTRTSFTTAARRLGAGVIDFDARSSSLSKGETLLDTAQTIIAGGAECLVLRHRASGAARHLSRLLERADTRIPIINAGDGMHEHPTQGLLDVATLERTLGDLAGTTVAIVGDALHSRVARSLVFALRALGASARLVGPRAFVPDEFAGALDVPVFHDPIEGTKGAHAVYFLRIQNERQGTAAYLPNSAYHRLYSSAREGLVPDGAIVMHPGPFNLGVELHAGILDDKRTVILNQVAAGIPVRMAVLERALLDEWGAA